MDKTMAMTFCETIQLYDTISLQSGQFTSITATQRYNTYSRREHWWGIRWIYDIHEKDVFFTFEEYSKIQYNVAPSKLREEKRIAEISMFLDSSRNAHKK